MYEGGSIRVRNEKASFLENFIFIFQHNLLLGGYTFPNVPDVYKRQYI